MYKAANPATNLKLVQEPQIKRAAQLAANPATNLKLFQEPQSKRAAQLSANPATNLKLVQRPQSKRAAQLAASAKSPRQQRRRALPGPLIKPTECAVCGFKLADDPYVGDGKTRMEYFFCSNCDVGRDCTFYLACKECVRARWEPPEWSPFDFPILCCVWSEGCPRCDKK